MKFLFFLTLIFNVFRLNAQVNTVTYAGGSGDETFYDVMQLSNGTFIVVGTAQELNWVNASVPIVQLNNTAGIDNSLGTDRYAFILHLSSDLQTMLRVVALPQNVAEDFRFIKSTNAPTSATGSLLVSGTLENNDDGGYFIGKLDHNFVDAIPTQFDWTYNVNGSGYPKDYHPWDVAPDGDVFFVSGESHGYNWHEVGKLDGETGTRTTVENWHYHWDATGTKHFSESISQFSGPSLVYSGIILKRQYCDLRSNSQADFDAVEPDGNGGLKKGKRPADFLFSGPCDADSVNQDGPGYTGYGSATTFTYGASSVCVDRRNGNMYLGMNFKTVLPGGDPDFEPAVVAFDSSGTMLWWSRLYHEITPAGDTVNSSPDQYVDALAIDYSKPLDSAVLVVNARCHGNNIENLWEGNTILANPAADGFQNGFTGSNGNIHISWLGKLTAQHGTLLHSTYVAEYAEGASGFGTVHPDPNLDGWYDPNTGWMDVNTTKLAKNNMKVTANGSVCVLGTGRRTITTANAYQKMVKPQFGGVSSWNAFVRVYENDLSKPLYSSLVNGQWDTLTQAGGGNVTLYGVWKTVDGLVSVGYHNGDPNELPVTNVPSWGNANFNSGSAVLVHYTATNLYNENDGTEGATDVTTFKDVDRWNFFPNPTTGTLQLQSKTCHSQTIGVDIVDVTGRTLRSETVRCANGLVELNVSDLQNGFYTLRLRSNHTVNALRFVKM